MIMPDVVRIAPNEEQVDPVHVDRDKLDKAKERFKRRLRHRQGGERK